MFKVNNKNTRKTSLMSLLCFFGENVSHLFFGVSLVGFEQVNVSWIFLVFLLLTLNEHVIPGWETVCLTRA